MTGRVELQGRWPYHAPLGEVRVTSVDGELRIDHADPQVTISAELLEDIAVNPTAGVSLQGGVLRIEGSNRTVIYRLGEFFAPINAYAAEWPD